MNLVPATEETTTTDLTPPQKHASTAISRHSVRNPDSVVIASIKDGHIMVDVTPFENLSGLALLKEMINKFISESIERGLMAGNTEPTNPAPAPTPETPT